MDMNFQMPDVSSMSAVQPATRESTQGVRDALGDFGDKIGGFFSGVGDFLFNTPQRVQDWFKNTLFGTVNNATQQGEIAYTKSGLPYDKTNVDSQINALMQEYAYKRDDESYSRLIKQLKENGINPAIALSNSASPMSSDTGYRSNYSLTDKDQVNSALKAGSILALVFSLLLRK